jgi:hypothetical protein
MSLTKKAAFAHDSDRRFLADLDYDGESHFAFLDIKNSVRSVPLRKYHFLLGDRQHLPAFSNGRKEDVGVMSENKICLRLLGLSLAPPAGRNTTLHS